MNANVSIVPGIDPEEIKDLYLASFPAEERREWTQFCHNASHNIATLYGICSDGLLAGFFTAWNLSNGVRYIEHLATNPDFRNRGIGAKALRIFTEADTDKPVLVEVERPGMTPEADRRIGFYQRCGFTPYPLFDYIQPPYADGLPEVPLMLMATGEIDPADTARCLHTEVYKHIVQ